MPHVSCSMRHRSRGGGESLLPQIPRGEFFGNCVGVSVYAPRKRVKCFGEWIGGNKKIKLHLLPPAPKPTWQGLTPKASRLPLYLILHN